MTRLTKDQIQFAKSMTPKQRLVLKHLSAFPAWWMSVSERADPELYELIRMKFAQCAAVFTGALPSWGVTTQGRRVAIRQARGEL